MRKRAYLVPAILALLICGCPARQGETRHAAPALLPHMTAEMRAPGFWVRGLADPDKIVLSADGIDAFNARTRDLLKLTHDVTAAGIVHSAADLAVLFRGTLASLREKKLFLADGTEAGDAFYRRFAVTPASGDIRVAYGILTRFADVRIVPADEGLYARQGDLEFDELQESGLDIGTPVAVLCATRDEEWLYVRSPLTTGWVKAVAVAMCPLDELRQYLSAQDFAVITVARAEIFRDADMTVMHGRARMGGRFPFEKNGPGDMMRIRVPSRASDGSVSWVSGFVERDDVHRGYLPYTARTVIEQAFKLLGAPYGWGDRRGAQDCSRFIQEIFGTVGIEMPRDSKDQEKVGVPAGPLDGSGAGITILKLDGHIMLYLGMAGGRPYAIHAIYGYREPTWRGDRVRVINRVTVSDLSLGEGSSRGSLFERLTTIRKITLP